MRPYFTRSSGSSRLSKFSFSFLPRFSWLKPSTFLPTLRSIMSRSPSNAPPQTNKIFVVSIWMKSWFGCFLPPFGGIFTTLPSMIFKSACCTPSPETSLVILLFSLILAILSISSTNTMPCSAFFTSPFAACKSLVRIFSTSSPTYPASVRLVASQIAIGTSRNLAKV